MWFTLLQQGHFGVQVEIADYKTVDGGENWEKILDISEHTGINEVHLDPRNPDVIYATAHQQRRHVFTYISGGPESAIYKSTDGGNNFRKIMKGMPSGDIGRIGLDISPANNDVIYATVEAQTGKSGFIDQLIEAKAGSDGVVIHPAEIIIKK